MDPIMIPITPILLCTIAAAIGVGWVGHSLFHRPKKRPMPPNGSALNTYTAVWADASHLKEMRK